jgi:hypothetical protein
MPRFLEVPSAIIGPALLAWYRAIHYQIPDPGPVEIGREEAAQLAGEVVRAVASYLPEGAIARGFVKEAAAAWRTINPSSRQFRETAQLEIQSHDVEGAPGCCVGINGHFVCVKVAR